MTRVLLCLALLPACEDDRIGVVRLAISESEIDDASVLVTGPDMLPVTLDFDAPSETFGGPVPAGDSRLFTFVGSHGGLPWYWGEQSADVEAGRTTDISIDAWPAGRLFVRVTLPTGEAAVGADATLTLSEGDPEAPALRRATTDESGGAAIWAPARREGGATPFVWEASATIETDVGTLTSPPLGFAVDLDQGAFVEVPVSLLDPGAPVRIALVVGSIVGGLTPEPTDLLVRLLDASGAPVPGYAGTISFDQSDTALLDVPDDYTFAPATDAGEHRFAGGLFALVASGSAMLAVRDVDRPTLVDDRTVDIVDAGTVAGDAVSFALRVKGGLVFGVASDVAVTALDAAGHVATGYRGTITFQGSDLLALAVPTDRTFGDLDLGVLTIPSGVLPLVPIGTAVLRVHDVAAPAIAGEIELPIE
jgi:hypothetical protein